MDWTKQAQHDFQNMPASDLVVSARAELVTAEDPSSVSQTKKPGSSGRWND
ncbi:hypothetical protein ACIQ7Q_06820 [Streptomyces sp. NPDC096176]|uniref:hypothetical protein n=1 Tax=Streptomyces sp. NPDC096176 TaxID=3366079 RepID=UPI003829DDC6